MQVPTVTPQRPPSQPDRCSSDIILVGGESQPDPLAAAALARTVNAAILLTLGASLSASAGNFIGSCVTSNGAQLVHIVGGEAAVSADVATSIDALANVRVNGISGLDRYETAAAIANTVSGPAIDSLSSRPSTKRTMSAWRRVSARVWGPARACSSPMSLICQPNCCSMLGSTSDIVVSQENRSVLSSSRRTRARRRREASSTPTLASIWWSQGRTLRSSLIWSNAR